MPLTIQPHHVSLAPDRSATSRCDPTDEIVIVIVNNMPDSALESTAAQFSRLLRTAAGSLTIKLKFCYLPEVPRGDPAREHVTRAYWHVSEVLESGADALIVTGLEPKAANLCDEPYWDRLRQLVAWAEENTASSIWSCLAAHAAVQILDGIARQRLERKRFGIFEHSILAAHPMMSGVRAPLVMPHSRWNDLPVGRLREAGYTIVSSSADTGADLFVKSCRSFFVFFQGHPEYDDTTLLKEYRRDVGRFLRHEQPHYPDMPHGYFSKEIAAELDAFQARALVARSPDLFPLFPIDTACASLQNPWVASAASIYRNWLALIAAAKNPTRAVAAAGS